MKRFLSILLCFSLIFAISACTGSGPRMSIIEEASSEYEPVQSQQPDQGTTPQQPDQGTTSQRPDQGTTSQQPDQGTTSPGTNDNPTTQQTPTVSAKPNNPTVMGTFYRNVIGVDLSSDDPAVKEVDAKADAMLNKIENYPDNISVSGKTYYISSSGKDSNNGLSPSSPKKSYNALKGSLKSGDAVLFKRGDIFRGQMILVSGVTYGAYGSGIKPRFYGSVDGKIGKWTETSTKGVYKYNKPVNRYSNIILNNGEALGRPVQKLSDITKKPYNVYTDGAYVTMYSPNGNPNDIFHSIEIVEGVSLMTTNSQGLKDVKLQNLCLMYTGVHFLGSLGCTYNLEIEGCIMGYCGGRDLYLGLVSLGNCVEIVGVAVNINIHDNYFFQAYDAALTHQGPFTVIANSEQHRATNYTNIHYENNLIEYCTYDIEAFSQSVVSEQKKSPNGTFTYNDVYVKGNICRFTGYGWGSLDRPDKHVYNHFKYDAKGEQDANGNYTNLHVKPLYIENNIFDRSRKGCLGISTPESNKANMILKNNQFLETDRANIFGGKTLKDDYMSEINKHFTASGNTFKIVK